MMVEHTPPVNPYHPDAEDDALSLVPFAGRQKAFERLYQQLTDPIKADTTILMGWRHTGKTALLQHFHSFFDESFVSVYLPLRHLPLEDEDGWLRALARRTIAALVERSFTLSRLPDRPPDENHVRAWLEDIYMPEVFNVIRRHRRLVWLMDDADCLLRAIDAGRLPEDSFVYLNRLLQTYRQFGIVLTLDTRYEADIPRMSPLASLTGVFRLTHLLPEECAQLLQQPVGERYTVSGEAAAAIHRATGGHPRLMQRFGFHLFRFHEEHPALPLITSEHVRQIAPAVYAGSAEDFRQMWQSLNQNERLVLTAVASLLYADPTAPITTGALETWLVETDYLLDATAINAAIRSLEYREVLAGSPLHLTAGLMQTWLLDNARLAAPAVRPAASPAAGRRLDWRLVALAALFLIILVLLVASLGEKPPAAADSTPQPTVTLAATPTP